MLQIVAALILAGGAYFGVYRGAVYAVGRLVAQLDEERRLSEERLDAEAKRLQMQLDAEAARLDRQLEHDQRMRDLVELRATLDEIGAATAASLETVAKARGAKLVAASLADSPIIHPLEADADRAWEEALAALQGLLPQMQRLRFRFGDAHPVTQKYTQLRTTMMTNLLRKEVDETADDDWFRKTGEQYLEFVELCRPFVGVKELRAVAA